MANGWARIACTLAANDPMAAWYRESLEHAGLKPEVLPDSSPSELGRTHVLLLCGRGSFSPNRIEALSTWIENGGCLVVSGGTWGLESVIGLIPGSAKHNSVSYTTPSKADRLWPSDAPRAKSFGAISAQTSTAIAVASIGDQAVVTRMRHGKGYVLFVGFHIGQTFNQMVLGRSVEVDGIGAADGTAQLDDGVLRAEDGMALDFEVDRETVEGGTAPFFGEAHADIVREVWIRAIFEAVDHSDQSVAVPWHWPNNANAVATLTLDVHDFEVDRVISLQRTLTMFGCQATWLIAMPGYATDVYRALKAMDHEVGLLFHVDDHNGWREEKLRIQLTNLTRLASWPHMGTVRVDDGQWRGWTQFYDACENSGARMSLNKMGRQAGTSGFLFGTCQPFFPVRTDGRESLTCELPGQIWQPGLVTSEQVSAAMVAKVLARNGCLHIGMTPESMADAVASMSLRRILSESKERRIQFVKPDEIYRFERGRRQMKLSHKQLEDTALLQIASETEVQGVTFLLSGQPRQARDRHGVLDTFTVERWGTKFTGVTVDVPNRQLTDLEWIAGPAGAQRAA